ncbi:hypothetical protein DPEC_G00178580 [Dallia pectoralis]|uniref:Uncharacterized protein n=1 Tax=Dallia pectoralis TaxID=75939 RepID=A0ACC2GFE4_DALPE|nr:hypothetical protein DPEC_G00178580 [Dallia pectoralis]
MSEGVVRKIQPFTIGTRLSVPSEAKSQEFVDVNRHKSAALSKLEPQNNLQVYIFRGQSQSDTGKSEFQQVGDRDDTSTAEEIQDERVEEDRNSLSPTASSRSIRKIVICRNAKMARDVSLCDSDLSNPEKSTLETNTERNNCVHPNLPFMKIKENLEKGSNSQSEMDTWFKRTLRDWKHDCIYLGGPLKDQEVTSPTEQRDLKDIEYCLIELTRDQTLKQADNIICTINRKRSNLSRSDDQESCSEMEINTIASQVMMLNQTVSRLSDLHPTLAARVTWKQAEVQESWELLQEARRSNLPGLPTTPALDYSSDQSYPLSQTRDTQGTTKHNAHVIMEKDIKEEQNQLNVFKHMTQILRINLLLSRCAELSMDILDTEADMAVRCTPDLSGLEELQEQHDELEIDYKLIREEVEEMERLASRLQLLHPYKASALREEIQTTLQAWEELGWSVAENRCRLQQFRQLQDFLMNYLDIISWTEDIHLLIFSEASTQWRSADSTVPLDLDLKIQQKFGEVKKLAAAGLKLIKEKHHLSDIIKEKTEELQSMLGWILVHWRAQKDQHVHDKLKDVRSEGLKADTTNQTQGQPLNVISLAEPNKSFESLPMEKMTVGSWVEQSQKLQNKFDGLPKRQKLGHREPNFAKPINIPSALAASSSKKVLEKPCAAVTPLGSSINLILSLDKQPPGGSLLQGPLKQHEAVESVHRFEEEEEELEDIWNGTDKERAP